MSVDVAYYLSPDEILAAVNLTRRREHYAAVLNLGFVDPQDGSPTALAAGRFFNEAGWRAYIRDGQLRVSMTAQGAAHYDHPLDDWLRLSTNARPRHYQNASGAMAWEVVDVSGPFLIIKFVATVARPRIGHPPDEVAYSTAVHVDDLYGTKVNLRSPGVEAGSASHKMRLYNFGGMVWTSDVSDKI